MKKGSILCHCQQSISTMFKNENQEGKSPTYNVNICQLRTSIISRPTYLSICYSSLTSEIHIKHHVKAFDWSLWFKMQWVTSVTWKWCAFCWQNPLISMLTQHNVYFHKLKDMAFRNGLEMGFICTTNSHLDCVLRWIYCG